MLLFLPPLVCLSSLSVSLSCFGRVGSARGAQLKGSYAGSSVSHQSSVRKRGEENHTKDTPENPRGPSIFLEGALSGTFASPHTFCPPPKPLSPQLMSPLPKNKGVDCPKPIVSSTPGCGYGLKFLLRPGWRSWPVARLAQWPGGPVARWPGGPACSIGGPVGPFGGAVGSVARLARWAARLARWLDRWPGWPGGPAGGQGEPSMGVWGQTHICGLSIVWL